ncbi:TIR domain-containing protein [Ktedonosporobacter rubrisoli]|uniref:TIR domain-containing protein n=1 Tax=Ktedonosporobacter rubrisoli TaxID=2509675 RepID=A0A4P6JY22_KTERU|nr:toll/interleukin-1 receptor domain-containing protein [Ktedonosporobacter rubrisoli]QBD79926.1 TIR domain-containing protein [Ktedonosporobacter rubrisoli]
MKQTNVTAFAGILEARRRGNTRTVLVLGSRAGAFFENRALYARLSRYSKRPFEHLAGPEKFQECFKKLRENCNESEVHTFLSEAVWGEGGLDAREEDGCLAELVKEGYFELIISTNIDTLLEDAFRRAKMRGAFDYRVFNVGSERGDPTQYTTRPRYCTLLKLFGDLISQRYTLITSEFDQGKDRELKGYLENALAGDVLVVGYDPLWDEPLGYAFPASGGDIAFVGEELPAVGSNMARVVEKRQGRYLVGAEGSYANFMRELHRQLLNQPTSYEAAAISYRASEQTSAPSRAGERLQADNAPLLSSPEAESVAGITIPSNSEVEAQRLKIFISYSHVDAPYFAALLKYLEFYQNQGLIEVWSDQDIGLGDSWFEEIKRALALTRVAILLVSIDFLNSNFINEHELPPLLEAADESKVKIVPVIVRHCPFDASGLQRFQAANKPSQPISSLSPGDQEAKWVEIAQRVKDLYRA